MPHLNTSTAQPVELYYTDVGTGQPVVLVHCWPLSSWVWTAQITALSAAGFRCIAYDRRGFGASGKPDTGYDYDTLADDLHALITALDLHDVVLVGYSMGGGDVVRYLERHGDRRVSRVVLLSTVLPCPLQSDGNPQGVPREVYDGLMAQIRADRDALLEGVVPAFFGFADPTERGAQQILQAAAGIARSASVEATAECVRAFGTTDFSDVLPSIRVPVLIVHGTDDVMVPFEGSSARAAALIPGCEVVMIRGAGHGVAVTHADELNTALLAFLGRA